MTTATDPHVLLIESASDLRDLNELILREANYQVETVQPDADPVDVAARTCPNAIVVQIRPNQPRDWQIIDGLNANPKTETIPIIVISSSERTVTLALAAPVVSQAIVMPYDIDALQQAVAAAFRHPPPAAVLPPAHHPPRETLARAGELLNAHSREITLRAIRRLQHVEPFQSYFAELSPGLVDNLPRIEGAILVGMQRDLSPEQTFAPNVIRSDLKEHVDLRLSQGLDPSAVIQEYQILSDEMLAFLSEHASVLQCDAVCAFDLARSLDAFMAETLRLAVNDFLARAEEKLTQGHEIPHIGKS